MVEVMFGRLLGMLGGVGAVGVGEVGVVRGLVVIAGVVVFCGFSMVMRG